MNNLLFQIDKGIHELNSAMKIEIHNDLNVNSGQSYLITGENGGGKSSFARNVLYKSLVKHCKGRVQYLYFDQDIISQFYFGQAYFSITKDKKIINVIDLITNIAQLHSKNRQYKDNKLILVLDETDKFISTINLLEIFNDLEITLFNISHQIQEDIYYDFQLQIEIKNEHLSSLVLQQVDY